MKSMDEPRHLIPSDITPEILLARIGQMVLRWNNLEGLMQALLTLFVGGSRITEILVSGMGNMTLVDTLQTIVNDSGPPEMLTHIKLAIEFYDCLREYRNYYVHSARSIRLNEDLEFCIEVAQVTAKLKLKTHHEMLREDQIVDLLHYIRTAENFTHRLYVYSWWLKHKPLWRAPPPSLPGMPRLPRRLQKPRLYRPDDPDRPLASEE